MAAADEFADYSEHRYSALDRRTALRKHGRRDISVLVMIPILCLASHRGSAHAVQFVLLRGKN